MKIKYIFPIVLALVLLTACKNENFILESKKEANRPVLYVYDTVGDVNQKMALFGPSVMANHQDVVILSEPGNWALLKNIKGTDKYLISNDSILYWFSTTNKEKREIAQISSDMKIVSAVPSHDSKYIAFSARTADDVIGAANEAFMDANPKIQLFILDIEKGETKKILDVPSGKFEEFRILGWTPAQKELVVQYSTSEYNHLSKNELGLNVYSKIKIDDQSASILEADDGTLSQDGKLWLHTDGNLLKILDMESNKDETVYSYLPPYIKMPYLKEGEILSFDWESDSQVIFSIPEGIFRVDLATKKAEQLKFDDTTTDPEEKNRPWLIKNVSEDYLALTRNEKVYFLGLENGKLLPGDGEVFNTGYFKPDIAFAK